jgi:hypothetical protein
MCDQVKLEAIKKLIGNSSRFVSISFIKADGTPRTIVFNKKVIAGIMGGDAADQYQRAVATRKELHPNLISVFDSQLASKGAPAHSCWRSANSDTTYKVVVDGETHKFML